jgi:uncharacterized protein (DUF4415 family)
MLRTEKGDKVRVRSGCTAGARGVVESIVGDRVVVRLSGQRRVMRLGLATVTNLSLAARKAWASMPARNVGRPKGTKTVDRVSVTLRIDREVWDAFRSAPRS